MAAPGNYIAARPDAPLSPHQDKIIDGLSRAGTVLPHNLFKRLESAGPAFLLSIERHILRNFIVLYAIENGLDIPLGTQGAELLLTLREDGRLCVIDEQESQRDPKLICSMGLA